MQPTRQHLTHKNHYLPQRYQLGFAQDEMLWVYDRHADNFRHGHPKTVGFINDFYTTHELGGEPTDAVEKALALLESTVWPVIGRLDARRREWGDEDRANLALFAAFLKTRIPAFDRQQNLFAEDFLRWWAKARNPSPEAIAASFAEATGESVTVEQANELHRMIQNDEYEVKNPRQNNIKLMLNTSLDLAAVLVQMNWTVLWSPKNMAFILSDNPCVLIPPSNFDETICGVGVLTPGATTLIPLSARTLLCLHNGEPRGRVQYGNAGSGLIRSANLNIAANSDRFIMARDEAHLRSLVKRIRAGEWRNEFRLQIGPLQPKSSETSK